MDINEEIEKAITVKVWGNTFPFKEQIKNCGGSWNGQVWSVRRYEFETALKPIFEAYNAKLPSAEGQLWELCSKCGQDPTYVSLGGLCESCGGVKPIFWET